MKTLLRLATAAALALIPSAALAQESSIPGKPIAAPAGFLPGTAIYCDDGTGHAVMCSFASGGGGGGGTGDASATNQTTQIARETSIRDQIGALSSPATGSTNYWLGAVHTRLGTPFQAGGSIANTAFGISGTLPAFAATPTVNLGTIGASATAANQATGNASLATIATNSGAGRDTGGRLLPGQGVVASIRTALATASTATSISAAVPGRIGLSIMSETALTANVYVCTTQAAACSATNYDFLIPSGQAGGTIYTALFAPNTAIYAFTTGTPTLVLNNWTAQ